jgi:hypothetical protein
MAAQPGTMDCCGSNCMQPFTTNDSVAALIIQMPQSPNAIAPPALPGLPAFQEKPPPRS